LLLREIKTNPWIAHNANFELIWFMHLAEMLREPAEFMPYDDSMAMGRLKHKRSMALSLDDMSMITTGVNVKALTSVNAANIMAYPLAEILPYNGLDAWGSAQIERLLLPGIMDEHEENYKRFIDSIYATAGMEYMGLDIDLRASENQRSEWATEKAAAYSDSRQIYEVKQFEKELQREFNIGSADDVGEALVTFGKIPLPKTGGGKQYKTDEDTLTALAPDNPLVKAVLRYRGATKMIETYIEPIASVPAVYRDGKVHPGYTTMLTATTRLSSNGPNIQNFPKRKHKELREQIIAPPGHLLYAFDFGQLEARVIAMVTKDKVLCQSIIDGRDIHSDWLNNCLSIYPDYLNRLAEETNQTEEKKIRKAGRDIIKTHFVFASFFGSSSKSVSDLTRIPLPLVNELHEDFWAEFRGVKAWIKDRRAVYDATGSMHLLTGIERHTINFGGNETINTPVQGTAACLVVDAMNELAWTARETNDCYIHPRVNIHDDLMFILPEDPDKAEPYIQGIMETMVQVRYPWQIVPLMIEAKLGPSWADLEEFTTYTGDYYRGR
jgi:DNA polymerase-1